MYSSGLATAITQLGLWIISKVWRKKDIYKMIYTQQAQRIYVGSRKSMICCWLYTIKRLSVDLHILHSLHSLTKKQLSTNKSQMISVLNGQSPRDMLQESIDIVSSETIQRTKKNITLLVLVSLHHFMKLKLLKKTILECQ